MHFGNYLAGKEQYKRHRERQTNACLAMGISPCFPHDDQRVTLNEEDGRIDLRIDGFISEWTQSEVAYMLKHANRTAPLHYRESSGGGDVFSGMAISNMIMAHEGDTFAYIDGKAFSAAALIFLAADNRYMRKGVSRLMFHRAWTCFLAGDCGNADAIRALDYTEDIKNEAEWLDGIDEDIKVYIAERIGMPEKDVWNRIDGTKEWKLSATQAVDVGAATDFENPGPHSDPDKKKSEEDAVEQEFKDEDRKGRPIVAEVGPEVFVPDGATIKEFRAMLDTAYQARVNRM